MSRIVDIPNDLLETLKDLANLKNETNGVLIYKNDNRFCRVSTLFMTGSGTPGHVISDSRRINVVNKLFQKDPSLRFVKFHTHTLETARLYGDIYLTQFSTGDIEGYREQFKLDQDFIAMLVTPKVELLCGLDNPVLQYSDPSPELMMERFRVESMYEPIFATEVGSESRLQNTRSLK